MNIEAHDVNYYVTHHARERWDERFPDSDIEQQLQESTLLWRNLGTHYRVSPRKAVFVIAAQGTVKTILTLTQYNTLRTTGYASEINRRVPVVR